MRPCPGGAHTVGWGESHTQKENKLLDSYSALAEEHVKHYETEQQGSIPKGCASSRTYETKAMLSPPKLDLYPVLPKFIEGTFLFTLFLLSISSKLQIFNKN